MREQQHVRLVGQRLEDLHSVLAEDVVTRLVARLRTRGCSLEAQRCSLEALGLQPCGTGLQPVRHRVAAWRHGVTRLAHLEAEMRVPAHEHERRHGERRARVRRERARGALRAEREPGAGEHVGLRPEALLDL